MSNPWEVVKNPKKTKIPQKVGNVGNKKKSKFDIDSMPKLEVAAPLKESPTIYDPFIEKDDPQPTKSTKDSKENVGNGVASGSQRKSIPNKKKTDKHIVVKRQLDEVVTQLDKDELETVLLRDQTTFPDNPTLWLMDIASVINLKLDNAQDCDPVLEGKPKDYPLCLLPSDCKTLVVSIMKQCSSKKLEGFLEQCIQHMMADMAKGISTHGYRMFIQLISKESPSAITNNLQKYVELIKNNQNKQKQALSIMWAVGQIGKDDFEMGLLVWFTVMMPYLKMSEYIVTYLENLFSTHKNWATSGCVISEKQFFYTFDVIHDPTQLSLPGKLQKRLLAIYPNIKKLAMAPAVDGLSKLYFPSFLKRCEPTCREVMKKELLDCLVTCLVENKHDFSQWMQMYPKSMPQSGVLLNHIAETWKTVGKKLDRESLKGTIVAFTLKNEELAKKGKNVPECDQGCKDITEKMRSGGFPWVSLLLIMFSMVAAVITYDIYLHKSFKDSKTRQLLSDSGVLVYLEHAWSRTELYAGKVWDWLQVNIPQYYARMCVLVGPYLAMFWEKLCAFGLFIVEVTQPAREWLEAKVPLVLEWVNQQLPWIWDYTSYYTGLVLGFVVKYSLIVWDFVCHYSFIVGAWLQDNVFTGSWSIENIQKILLQWLDVLRTFIHDCGVKLSNAISGADKA